jgi:hypothetical protein
MSAGSLRHPLDQLADEIHAVWDERTAEQQLALAEVLGMIEDVKRRQAAIEAEHVPGRVYSPEQR